MSRDHVPILIFLAVVAVGLTLLAPTVWLVLLTDGLLAAAVVAAAIGWGAWPGAWLGFGPRSAGQQFCVAAALGLGWLGILTLVLGALGLLNRPTAWIMLAVGGLLGLARLYLAQSQRSDDLNPPNDYGDRRTVGGLVLLALVVPLLVALFGASLPPGVLWQEEARGYDVLEYHLQGPREYYEAGRITFLPHNVYTSFPQQMETLYLLLMHLAGDVYAAAIPAQLLHAACGILAVIALGCWARPGWGRLVVLVIAGSTPWLAYLGCLAYVENGMLFFTAVAAGLVVDHFREQAVVDWRTTLAAGLCAGLAGGCKYPALAFVTVSLGLAWLVTMRASLRQRAQRLAAFGLGAVLAFSPWLIRNAAFTGNPVYPFAHEWLGGKAWSAEQSNQWSDGHRVLPEHDSLPGRLALAARELFGSLDHQANTYRPSLFGPVLFLLALAGAALGWSGPARLLLVWTGLIFLGWIALTFITGRFAVPLVVPLAMLAGRAAGLYERAGAGGPASSPTWLTRRSRIVLLVALLGALANDISLAGRLRDHGQRWVARAGVPMRALLGQTHVLVSGHPLNQALPANAHAWLIGDAAVFYVDRQIHYTVAFSRDPWLEFAANHEPRACVEWLRRRNISHVVFSWFEIERLRRTYGFAKVVTAQWVAQLEQAGLRRLQLDAQPFVAAGTEIYEVPPGTAD